MQPCVKKALCRRAGLDERLTPPLTKRRHGPFFTTRRTPTDPEAAPAQQDACRRHAHAAPMPPTDLLKEVGLLALQALADGVPVEPGRGAE
jgi:hypothetical protein